MSTPRGQMLVTSFETIAKNDPDWIIRAGVSGGLANTLKNAGVQSAGHENNVVVLLLGIDGYASDRILTDSPRWTTQQQVPQTDLYDQLVDARSTLNIAIEAMETGQ